jgi:hypothetical protein
MTSKWLPFSHLDLRKENILHASGPHQTLLLSTSGIKFAFEFSIKKHVGFGSVLTLWNYWGPLLNF